MLTDSVKARLTGQERKHNACRADIGGCFSGNTYISGVCASLLGWYKRVKSSLCLSRVPMRDLADVTCARLKRYLKKIEADYAVITHIPQIVQGDEYQVILASMSAQLLSN